MDLKTWLEKNDISNMNFAKKIGVHFSYITHINKGRRNVSPRVAEKIQRATGGAVTIMELLYPDQKNRAEVSD